MFDSPQPYWLQHTRFLCPSLSPRVCSYSCPLSRWCYVAISSSVTPFSFPQSFPASGWDESALHIKWVSSSHQVARVDASASKSVLPMNIQDWFPLGWTCLIFLQSKGLLRVFSSTTIWKHWFFGTQLFYCPTSHPYMTTGTTIDLTRWTIVGKVMSLLFNMLSRFVIAFLPNKNFFLIFGLQPLSAIILEPKKIKSVTASAFSPSICHKVMGLDAMVLGFLLSFKPAFSLSSFNLIKKLFSLSSLSAIRGVCVICVKISHVQLFVTPWTIQSMEFSRTEYWDG